MKLNCERNIFLCIKHDLTHCVASRCLQVKIFPSTLVKKQGGGGVVSYFYSHAFMKQATLFLAFFHFMHSCDDFCIFFAAQLGQDSLFEVIFEFNHTLKLSWEVFYAFLKVTKSSSWIKEMKFKFDFRKGLVQLCVASHLVTCTLLCI